MTGTGLDIQAGDLEMTLIATSSSHRDAPEFSICIPQFNRTSFLIEACKSLALQSFPSFEICISDDCSTDEREEELASFLHSSGMDFTYARQVRNRRYDGNLRGAISLARGKFVFLLGNDDRIAEPDTLFLIHQRLLQEAPVHVALTNYAACSSGREFHRVSRPGLLGAGPSAAVRTFRDFAFVSGVIFDTAAARQWSTKKWDGSEMYQMYLACRILAAGGNLLGIGEVCIQKDIQIAAESVDSYATVKLAKKDFSPVALPMAQIAPLVTDAIGPYLDQAALRTTTTAIVAQLLVFTYAFWLVEFRRVQSWRYAASVYRGLSPRLLLNGQSVGFLQKSMISLIYLLVGFVGLLLPIRLFQLLQPALYRLAKRRAA